MELARRDRRDIQSVKMKDVSKRRLHRFGRGKVFSNIRPGQERGNDLTYVHLVNTVGQSRLVVGGQPKWNKVTTVTGPGKLHGCMSTV